MRISDWSSDVCSSDLVDQIRSIERYAIVLVLKLFLLPVGGQPGLRATEIAVVGQRLIIAAMAFEKGRETVVRRSAGGFGIGQVIVSALQGHIMARCDDHTKLGVDVAVADAVSPRRERIGEKDVVLGPVVATPVDLDADRI